MFQGTIVAIVTPFDKEHNVDETALREIVQWQITQGIDGILCLGTTGEGPTLCTEEEKRVMQICVSEAQGRVPIIANTGTNCSRTSLEKTLLAKNLGVDACLSIVPYYNKPTPLGCLYHFKEISKANLPMLIYHHPGRTGIALTALELSEICGLPQVVGVKDCSGDEELVSAFTSINQKPLLTGDDDRIIPMLGAGASGVISVLANLLPKEWKEMVDTYLSGNKEAAIQMQQNYNPFVKAIFNEVNPQGIKFAMSLLRKIQPTLRLPLIEPSTEHKDQIESAFRALLLEAV